MIRGQGDKEGGTAAVTTRGSSGRVTTCLAHRQVASALVALLVVTSGFTFTIGMAGTAAGATKKADVVFVFDKTGSMDDQADALKNEVENVSAELESRGVDARYGLVTYEGDENTEIRTPLSSDTQDLVDGLGFSTEGGTEDASDAINFALSEMSFRSDAKKIFVVITDEDDDSPADTREAAIANINDADACLVSVSPGGSDDNDLQTIAERVDCGRWTDIDSESFTTVVTDVVDIIEEVAEEVEEEPKAAPNFVITKRSISTTSPNAGEPVQVSVTVENDGNQEGLYRGRLTTTDDLLRSEQVEIEEGEAHTFNWTVTFDEADDYWLQFNYRVLAEVVVEPRQLTTSEVEVVDASVTRSTVWQGQTYEVVSTVRNDGDRRGQASVAFNTLGGPDTSASNPTMPATETVLLGPGETAELRHTVRVRGPVNNSTTSIWMANGVVAGNVSVLPSDEVGSGVVDAYAQPSSVAPGDSYDIVAVVHNPSETEQGRLVAFGNGSAVKYVTVEPGATTRVTRSVNATETAGNTTEWRVSGVPVSVEITTGG